MSGAIGVLKQELEMQKEKLAAVIEENQQTIEAGKRAEQSVAVQRRHVEDIDRAIILLEDADREAQREEVVR